MNKDSEMCLMEGYLDDAFIREYLCKKIISYPEGSIKQRLYKRLLDNSHDMGMEICLMNRVDRRLVSRDKVVFDFIKSYGRCMSEGRLDTLKTMSRNTCSKEVSAISDLLSKFNY